MATKSFGGSIKLQGESEYRRALSNINDDLKVLGSELKAAASQFDENDRSVENLSKQNEILNKRIEEQEKKVRVLRDALNAAKTETGEESDTTKKWQNELNNAQADLNKLNRQLESNERDMKAAEDATDAEQKAVKELGETAESTGPKFSALGDAVKAGLAVAASAIASVTAACVAIGKQAITLYADYEQLVGGVETLFGESADIIKGYADNAYKSAGLSANEYMETVTGFSASLIQSLEGDTEAAAKKADMAITDMSDNANKMGSDIQSIMSAYSGFAKGQFTLLDNLKLGYGGTKTEMERLLKDAQAISGIEYNLNSYADIVDAIHVIQTEMGITGTTAREASTTIQGSLGAMKSSWQNLLTGVAGGGQDFKVLIKNMTDSVLTFGKNIIPVVKTTIGGIGELFKGFSEELLPEILSTIPDLVEELLPVVVSGVGTLLSSIGDIISGIIPQLPSLLSTLFTEILPQLITTAVTVLQQLVSSMITALPGLMTSLATAIVELATGLFSPENIKSTVEMINSFLKSVISGLSTALPILIEGIGTLVEGIITAIPDIIDMLFNSEDGFFSVDNINKIIGLAGDLVSKVFENIPTIITGLIDAIPKIIEGLFDPETGFLSITNVGKLLGGVLDLIGKLLDHIDEIVVALCEGVDDLIDGVCKKLGEFVADFLGVGESWARAIGEGFQSAIKSFFGQGLSIRDIIGDEEIAEIIANRQQVGEEHAQARANADAGRYEMATGGIVSRPTRILAGEAGAEAIIPLENNTGWIRKVAEDFHRIDAEMIYGASLAARSAAPPAFAAQGAAPMQFTITFGDVTIANDMDIRDVADQLSERIAQNIIRKGGGWN